MTIRTQITSAEEFSDVWEEIVMEGCSNVSTVLLPIPWLFNDKHRMVNTSILCKFLDADAKCNIACINRGCNAGFVNNFQAIIGVTPIVNCTCTICQGTSKHFFITLSNMFQPLVQAVRMRPTIVCRSAVRQRIMMQLHLGITMQIMPTTLVISESILVLLVHIETFFHLNLVYLT